jgi:large subunit ribosomal protein L15
MNLNELRDNPGARLKSKRLGRGIGSGKGKTSGKGVKGQKARPGHHGARLAFEGGQMPMPRRIPKRGFKNPFRIETFPINVATLEQAFEAGATVDLDALRGKGLVPKLVEHVKILGEGEITKQLTIKAYRASATAKEKIVKAGGTIEVADAGEAAAGAQGAE